MNDQRKTKKQLLEDLQRERERSIALQEISNKVAAAYNTDEVLNLIANAAGRLVHTDADYIRLRGRKFSYTRQYRSHSRLSGRYFCRCAGGRDDQRGPHDGHQETTGNGGIP